MTHPPGPICSFLLSRHLQSSFCHSKQRRKLTRPTEVRCRKFVAFTVTVKAAPGGNAEPGSVMLQLLLSNGSCDSRLGGNTCGLVRRKVKVSGRPPEPYD